MITFPRNGLFPLLKNLPTFKVVVVLPKDAMNIAEECKYCTSTSQLPTNKHIIYLLFWCYIHLQLTTFQLKPAEFIL